MTKEEMQTVIAEALKPVIIDIAALKAQAKGTETAATAQARGADDIKKIIDDALKPVTEKITTFETAAIETKKAQAKAAVAKYVGRVGLAPQDTKAIEFYEKAYLADPATTEELLGKLPKAQAAGARIITVSGTQTVTTEFSEPENRIFKGAQKIREGNKAVASDASALTAYLATPEGNAAYREILAGRSTERRDIQRAH